MASTETASEGGSGRVPEPGLENEAPKVPEGARREHGAPAKVPERSRPPGLLSLYSQRLATSVLRAALAEGGRGEAEGGRGEAGVPHGQERLMEGLASLTIHAALVETSQDPGSSTSSSRNPQSCCPSLPQAGLSNVGSLDYPDPPPTTPLLQELVRSRASFSRRLKGGLASEFLPSPSPPPPTPKDEATGGQEAVGDPDEDFVGRLLRSLSLETSRRAGEVVCGGDDFWSGALPDGRGEERGPLDRATCEGYAEALSGDIVGRATGRGRSDNRGLHLAAAQLAESTIMAAFDEIREQEAWRGSRGMKSGTTSEGNSPSRGNDNRGLVGETTVLAPELKPERAASDPGLCAEDPGPPEMERLRAYAGWLVSEALSQAVSELRGA